MTGAAGALPTKKADGGDQLEAFPAPALECLLV